MLADGVLPDYLADLERYLGIDVTRPFAWIFGDEREHRPVAEFRRSHGGRAAVVWDCPTILDAIAPATEGDPGITRARDVGPFLSRRGFAPPLRTGA